MIYRANKKNGYMGKFKGHTPYFYTIHQLRRYLKATMYLSLFSGAFIYYFVERYFF